MHPSQSSAPVQAGQVLAGKYRIERVLGAGGMGVVVAAQHLHLDERVALKFLLAEATCSEQALARFQREAQNAAKIKGENVARVIDFGVLETGAPFIVMEFLEGRDLEKLLEARGPLPIQEAIDLVLQGCTAIAEAHGLGIVHRDLKPSNFFLTKHPDGSPLVKVLDFGLSKSMLTSDAARVTATATGMGTPLYMSPEQIRDAKRADARTDVWAVGIVLYELLTGRSPFLTDSVSGVLANVLTEPAPPLDSVRRDVPPELASAVMGCLEKAPDRRTQSIAALAYRLAAFASDEGKACARRIARFGARAGSVPEFPAFPDGAVLAKPPAAPAVSAAPVSTTAPRLPSASGRQAGRGLALAAAAASTAAVLGLVAFVGHRMLSKDDVAAAAASAEAVEAGTTTDAVETIPIAASSTPAPERLPEPQEAGEGAEEAAEAPLEADAGAGPASSAASPPRRSRPASAPKPKPPAGDLAQDRKKL